jgi:peptidoglycan/LPS O-acetylase OafA/YrhL
MKERRHDIDWLRVIAMLTVFLFHCSRFFCTEDWHLKVAGPEQSDILKILRDVLVAAWFMELFFLVSGFATYYSLRRRTTGQYLLERVKRLLVPLYTVGILALVVPQHYIDGVMRGTIRGTFWQWLPIYYLTLWRRVVSFWKYLLDPVALLPYTFSGHLWFIQMLFLVSLVALPLLLWLRTEGGGRFIGRLAAWVARPGGILLFVIPLAVIQTALRWIPELNGRSWADLVWYACFFVIGYIVAADDRFTEAIKRCGWLYLALWIGVYVVVGGLLYLVLDYDPSPGHGISMLYLIWQIGGSVVVWSAVVFVVGLGARYLNFTNKLLAYGNEAVLPFFLFHQTIILIVGWFVLPWDINHVLQFLIIVLISFSLIVILYEVFVRHIGFMRTLFGMAPKKRQPAAPTSSTPMSRQAARPSRDRCC